MPSYWIGRFGNRMYQYAYAYTYSKKNNIDLLLPSEWEGSFLFKKRPFNIVEKSLYDELSNSHTKRNHLNSRIDIVKKYYDNVSEINVNSYECYNYIGHPVIFSNPCFYHEAIFSGMNKKDLIDIFEFSDFVKNTNSYKYWSSRAGQYNVAHLRRDDISNPEFNKNNIQWYSTISLNSYYKAFDKFGFDKNSIEFVSDDYIKKWHKDRSDSIRLGWSYPEGSEYSKDIVFDWLDDFLKIYFSKNVFRANSSFSWWACFLSPTANVFSPVINEYKVYGRNESFEEIDVEFIEGNSPHWFYEPGVYFSKNEKREIIINE
jgi:hypothetical protein